MDNLLESLKNFGHARTNIPISRYTTFKIGGPARYFVEVTETDKLIELLNYLSDQGVEFFLLGSGSNILFKDEEYDGVVILVKTTKIECIDDKIFSDAGAQFGMAVNISVKNSLTGLEWAIGIPGTMGGAIRGNAGAMGQDIAGNLVSTTVWRNGEIITLSPAECGFVYRGSALKEQNDVVLSSVLQLAPGDKQTIVGTMQAYLKQRTGRYPAFPSAGSFFKNINVKDWPGDISLLPEIFIQRKKIPVGWCVEQVEMKGFAIGGARVSNEHGNFIINYENATQNDVLQVVEAVQSRVYNKFKIALDPEVEVIL